MGTEVRNLAIAEAQRRLDGQLAPRDEQPTGGVQAERYEEATAEQKTLAAEYKFGHEGSRAPWPSRRRVRARKDPSSPAVPVEGG